MKKVLQLLLVFGLLHACQQPSNSGQLVRNEAELTAAISKAQAGDRIIMANGEWKDIQIKFAGNGTENKPIILCAETPGKVFIQGESDLKLGGEYLWVSGLHFINGYSPSNAVIEFSIGKDQIANHCRITNCVIEDFNKLQKNHADRWVQFKGRHNQLDHCYLAGKSNRGPTIRVDLAGNEHINNYHKIIQNHFGPRPPKGGPSAETIQIGNSYTSVCPSYTMVAENLFDHCNGEVEVISSKTNFNEFRNNVFYKSEGSLVTRHGNYCIVDGNYFIGDEESEQIGGIRLIGTGHWVTNNYFYNLKGQIFRSPLAVMNGIPKSPLNRYIQVTDVVVAYNTWVNCSSPLQFGVGSNVEESDVLPASEIRSARPIRTTVANNVIYNEMGDARPVVAHDKLDGINFKSNFINNQGVDFEALGGLDTKPFELQELVDNIWVPAATITDQEIYQGFAFEQITKDLFGKSRTSNNAIGAMVNQTFVDPAIMDLAKYGPDWFTAQKPEGEHKPQKVNSAEELTKAIAAAVDGGIIEMEAGVYEIAASLKIDKKITIQAAQDNQATILYKGAPGTPAFEMNPKGELLLRNIQMKGDGQYAFAPLKENMSSLYNLSLVNCAVSGFEYILHAYKHSFSEHINLSNTSFENCENGLVLASENDDKGEYNAENLHVSDCHFEGISQNVINYYRGGYDESTVGGNLKVKNSTFTRCGAKEKSGVLLNTYGIINVDLANNIFKNNPVKLVALLWGAKNNQHAGNEIMNSGSIVVEENLRLKLMY